MSEYIVKAVTTPSTNDCIKVLFIGEFQSEKSTVIETLLNPDIGIDKKGFSITRNYQIYHLEVYNTTNQNGLNLSILDCPDVRKFIQSKNSTEPGGEISQEIKEFIGENFSNIDVIGLITHAGETGFNDLEVFEEAKTLLGSDFSGKSMLILTHCGEFNDSKITAIISELRQHPRFNPIFSYCSLGVYVIASIDSAMLQTLGEELAYQVKNQKLENVRETRIRFIESIIKIVTYNRQHSERLRLESVAIPLLSQQPPIVLSSGICASGPLGCGGWVIKKQKYRKGKRNDSEY